MKQIFVVGLMAILVVMGSTGSTQSITAISESLKNFSSADYELRLIGQNKIDQNQIYYYNQQLYGLDIYNRILLVVTNEEGQVIYTWQVRDSLPVTQHQHPQLSITEAIYKTMEGQLSVRQNLHFIKQEGPQAIFSKGTGDEISAQLGWLNRNNQLRLVYRIDDRSEVDQNYWRIWVDALTGEIFTRESLSKSCFPPGPLALSDRTELNPEETSVHFPDPSNFAGSSSYLVFPFPAASPSTTAQTVLTGPADPLASPFGWHDTDGKEGPEFTITKGNNATVFVDRNADFIKDGPEPDGGINLQFAQSINLAQEPEAYTSGSAVQLFYQINTLHDVLFHHGFDEQANYQQINYSAVGKSGDPVVGLVQYGADRNEKDNADFIPSTDGKIAYIRPYIWTRNANQLLTITSPSTISGLIDSRGASFGPQITTTPISGKVVIYQDGTSRPNLACQAATNATDLKGRIALIDRGICFFQEKILNAQKAGAIACIICNYENALVSMGEVGGLEVPSIPAIAIKYNNCQAIKSAINSGVNVRLQLPQASGTNNLDATLDNGVIAHEYYHGVTERLVGGPQTIGCLNNIFYDTDRVADDGEQMGEGWSDFFTLFMTTSDKDSATAARGIANYLLREGAQGKGVRLFPYSTNQKESPYKYEDIWTATVPHGVGSVWNAILWDIYWEFVTLYGFDNNLIRGNGGNNKALKLITEALKITPCQPGFIDGRDALLATDKLLFQNAHECVLWNIFAKRGIGFGASQGKSFLLADGKTSFDQNPLCSQDVILRKSVTPQVRPGEDIVVTLMVHNYRIENVEKILVEDAVPEGLEFKPNSSNVSLTLVNKRIMYTHPRLAAGDSLKITYVLRTSAQKSSSSLFFDDMENGDRNWDFQNLDGIDIWSLEMKPARSGKYTWFVENKEAFNDQVLQNLQPWKVTGAFPVLKFYHKISSQWGVDGGVLEISNDQGVNWKDAATLMFRNTYQGPVAPATFLESGRRAFYGEMDTFEPVYVDLRPYKNQAIKWRWRFASNDAIKYTGWFIDDVQILDVLAYNAEVCISGPGLERKCMLAPGEGTLVEGEITTSVETNSQLAYLQIRPNPAHDNTFLSMNVEGKYRLTAHNLFGQCLTDQTWTNNGNALMLDTKAWPAGMYIITLHNPKVSTSVKLIKN